MIRGSNSDPISGFRTLAREYTVDVGSHTTASGYLLAASTLVSANNTPTAGLAGLGSVATPATIWARQSTNICFTMVLGTGTGITYVITVSGVNYYGDAVSEDVTVTDSILVASTLHCYQYTTSIVCKSFAGTAGNATIGVGYGNVGGTVAVGNAQGYRIPLPSKTFTFNDISSVMVNSTSVSSSQAPLATAPLAAATGASQNKNVWLFVGAPYYCLALRGPVDSTTNSPLAPVLASNPVASVTVRIKAGIGLG